MPNGFVPCLELDNGTRMGESTHLLRFLATSHGYYPKDADAAQRCNELVETIAAEVPILAGPAYNKDPITRAVQI